MAHGRPHPCHALLAAIAGALASAAAAAPDTMMRLPTGEVLKVQILETTETQYRVKHPWLGELLLPREGVRVLTEEEAAIADKAQKEAALSAGKAAPGAAAAPAPAAAPGTPAPPPAPPEPAWKFKLFAGGSLSRGNTSNANVSSKFTANYEDKEVQTSFDAAYFYGESSGASTDNKFTAGGRNNWLLPESPLFFFAQGRYDYDQFQSWRHRVSGHGGVGYRLFLPPPLKFNLIAGIGAIREFASDNERIRPEGIFGFEGEWQIKEKHKFVFDCKFYPDFRDLGEFRNVNSAGYSILIDDKNNLSLTVGFAHEYQSQVAAGRQHNDFRLFGGLEFGF